MTFEYEVFVDADIDTVWQAFRDKDQLRRWHGWHLDSLDAEIDLIYFTHATEDGHTLTLGTGDTFTLTDDNGRTLVRMVRAPKGNNPEWDAYYEDVNEGWTSFLQQLRFALERHPGADRETAYLSGDAGDAKVRELFALAGDIEPGKPYALTAPTDEQLAGEVWFRSPNQLGLTVSGWGDGLLIIGTVPVSQTHPDGGQMLIATTFPGSTFDEPSWRAWWS
ncbi:SRPBCC family protein [Catelliglobosispora koreensis]|uniref:SRPBCC family protein n=1 Tax=Catelliglobosispora koreensis TaxID=129052 RepID=UPI00037CDCFA|nr:SRPBCC domain-containing protein [Catelliglobosispora koreensis]